MKGKTLLLVSSAVLLLASCGGGSSSSSSAVNPSSSSSSQPSTGFTSDPTSNPTSDPTSDPTPSSESSQSSQPSTSSSAKDPGTHTYNTFTTVSPSNWNQLTYQDNNDTQIMDYLGGSFFNFNYQFDDKGNIIPGGFTVEYDAVSEVKDVTELFAGDDLYAVPEDATDSYAYEFTLRDDLKWDDGTPIKAEDFVYTMKEQENPLFKNYRADSYYNGSTVIHNAREYVYQGMHAYSVMISADYGDEEYVDMDEFTTVDGVWGFYDAAGVFHDVQLDINNGGNWGNNGLYAYYMGENITEEAFGPLLAAAVAAGSSQFALDATLVQSLQLCIAQLHGKASVEDYAASAGDYAYIEWQEMALMGADYAEVDFDDVGIFVGDADNKLVVVLDKALPLFKEDGKTLSYHAAYEFGSLPLVKKDLYEANKHAPELEDGLWTSTYCSDVESTASWGPYKLTFFQAGKHYELEKNPNWYGWNMPEYAGQFETDRIVCETIANYDTAFLAFEAGDIDSIGLDVSKAADYKNSQQAVFTASDFVGSLQLQSDAEALKERETEGFDKEMLIYKDFRQAISLSFDRADYAKTCTTASLPGYGLFNSMHYYDVENAGVYRNEDIAKLTLCEVYGVDVDDYASLDEAYATLDGGNDLALARAKVTSAYNEAIEAGTISATDQVKLVVGADEDTISTRRVYDFIKASLVTMVIGTPLEGRMVVEFDTSFGDKWATDFRDGAYDICTGGWTGAPWNPGYFLMAYLSPDYMYSKAWDTSSETLTLNPYNDDDSEHEYTMSLMDWWYALNGYPAYNKLKLNFGEGVVDTEIRLNIIAALEGAILEAYYSIPISNSFSARLISYKWDYITRDYNTFMGYGGIRYIHYNYTDLEWAAVKGTFDYKK